MMAKVCMITSIELMAFCVSVCDDIHGDDEVGASVARKAHGTGDEAAIDIGVAGDRHRLEHAGHGRRGPHGHAGITALKQDRLAGEVGGTTPNGIFSFSSGTLPTALLT
jgi:hypothetical protein